MTAINKIIFANLSFVFMQSLTGWSQSNISLKKELTSSNWEANHLIWGLKTGDTLVLIPSEKRSDVKFKNNHVIKSRDLKVGCGSPVQEVWGKDGKWKLTESDEQLLIFDLYVRKIELKPIGNEPGSLQFIVIKEEDQTIK